MNRSFLTRLPLWRRLGAAAALLGLLFVSLTVALPHAEAIPAPEAAAESASGHAGHAHDHGDLASHRHGPADQADASDDGVAPQDSGCVFCNDCTLCNLALAGPNAAPLAPVLFESFAPAPALLPAETDAAPAIKPPRA